MPTYEYRCEHCDRTFDVVQSFHDDPLTECPTCGDPVRKVFGNVGIVFKGSGFYKTDSRSGSSTKAKEPSAASSDGDSSTKPSETADSKSGSSDTTKPATDNFSKASSTPAPTSSATGSSTTP